jgi:hypothetical protein
MKEVRLYGTTSTAGSVTIDAPTPVFGHLEAVRLLIGSLEATTDIVVSCQNYAVADTLLTLTDASANALYYPRGVVHSEAGAALTGTSGGDRTRMLMTGVPRCAIASGGSAKSGGVILYYTEGE